MSALGPDTPWGALFACHRHASTVGQLFALRAARQAPPLPPRRPPPAPAAPLRPAPCLFKLTKRRAAAFTTPPGLACLPAAPITSPQTFPSPLRPTHLPAAIPPPRVRATEKYGHIVLLRLKDGAGSLLPVYIGEFECGALVKEINRKPTVRQSWRGGWAGGCTSIYVSHHPSSNIKAASAMPCSHGQLSSLGAPRGSTHALRLMPVAAWCAPALSGCSCGR